MNFDEFQESVFTEDHFEEFLNDVYNQIDFPLGGVSIPYGTALKQLDYHAFYEAWQNECDSRFNEDFGGE